MRRRSRCRPGPCRPTGAGTAGAGRPRTSGSPATATAAGTRCGPRTTRTGRSARCAAHRLPGLRVVAELALAAAAHEQLLHLLRGELVRGDAVRDRHRGPLATLLLVT